MQSHGKSGFAIVFIVIGTSVSSMSLNRCEQYLYDYIEGHKEERQHWRAKVLSLSRQFADPHELAQVLEGDLWTYFVERSKGSPEFQKGSPAKDLRRTSLRNLSEYVIRMWISVPTKPKKGA